MLLRGNSEIEEQRLLAEYWQTSYRLIETALKLANQRVIDNFGKERAETIFKEVMPSLRMGMMYSPAESMTSHTGAVAEEKKREKKD